MIDLGNLAAQGRAYSGSRPWNPEELDALLRLERERGLRRNVAADYIRNGILSLESYDAAVKAGFVPLTTEDAIAKAEELLTANKFASKVAEPVAEAPVAPAVEAVVEPVAEVPAKGITKGGKKK